MTRIEYFPFDADHTGAPKTLSLARSERLDACLKGELDTVIVADIKASWHRALMAGHVTFNWESVSAAVTTTMIFKFDVSRKDTALVSQPR